MRDEDTDISAKFVGGPLDRATVVMRRARPPDSRAILSGGDSLSAYRRDDHDCGRRRMDRLPGLYLPPFAGRPHARLVVSVVVEPGRQAEQRRRRLRRR